MNGPNGERCDECYYEDLDECHRYPPVLITPNSSDDRRPRARSNNWCGEFKPKPEVLNQ